MNIRGLSHRFLLYSVLSSASILCGFYENLYATPVINLEDAFQAAKIRSEILIDQDEQIKQIQELHDQALSTALPNITGVASITRQAHPAGTLFPEDQRLLKVNLNQSIFRGFKEFALLRSFNLQKEAQAQLKLDATKSLFNELSQNYFTILSLEEDLKILQTQIQNYKKRITELKHRIDIGRSRLTERLSVESLLANIQAQIAQDEGILRINRENFAFITGLPSNSLLARDNTVMALGTVDSYLESRDSRSDIQGANLRVEAAEENTKFTERQFYPSIDLSGNYYFFRNGPLKDVPWDISLTLTVPLYEGGLIRSQKRQALSKKTQASNELQLTKRRAEKEIRSFHESVKADLHQMNEFKGAFEIAKRNFRQVQEEYNSGLASNLEVLQAMSNLDDAKRNLKRTEYLAQMDLVKLHVSAEKISMLKSEN